MNDLELPYDGNKSAILEKIKRLAPSYKRNEAHFCSFFLKGNCNRGQECPFKHEVPEFEQKNIKTDESIRNRYYGRSDDLAEKMYGTLFP